MTDLPIELIVDILSRLPVKSLLRFRCVSKPFCALIDSRDFIKSHLKRSIDTKTHRSLILRETHRSFVLRSSFLYSLDLDSLDNPVELDHPFKSSNFGTEVLGSCDGLISLYNGDKSVAIWNPSTRMYRKLPAEEIEFPPAEEIEFPEYICGEYIIYGFGYDPVTDDYKVVRFTQFHSRDVWYSFESEAKVYSMKSNSWRRIQNFPYYLRYKGCYGVLVGSALHWVVSRNCRSDATNLIAAFDVTTEEYLIVPQPEFSRKDFHMNIRGLEGCLCILCNYINERVDVWVMKDYGVKESWTKLFSVTQPQVIGSFDSVFPLAYSKGGGDVLLVQDSKRLVWYDVKRKKIKKIKAPGIPEYFNAFVYVESLVPLGGGGETYGENHDVKEEKKKNETMGIPKFILSRLDC